MTQVLEHKHQNQKHTSRVAKAFEVSAKTIINHFALFAVVFTAAYSTIIYWMVHQYVKNFHGLEVFAFGGLPDIFRISWFIGFSHTFFVVSAFIVVFLFASLAMFAGSSSGKMADRVVKISIAVIVVSLFSSFAYLFLNKLMKTADKKVFSITNGKDFHYSFKRSGQLDDIKCVGLIGTTSTHHLVWDYWREDIHFRAIPISSVTEPEITLLPIPPEKLIQGSNESDQAFAQRQAENKSTLKIWHKRFNKHCHKIKNINHPQFKRIQPAKVG